MIDPTEGNNEGQEDQNTPDLKPKDDHTGAIEKSLAYQETYDETPKDSPVESAAINFNNRIDISPFTQKLNDIQAEANKVLIGQSELIELMIIAIVCDGHVLLEGVPGIAKTLSAKVMSKTLSADFTRIQFTPDLMPSDIIGTSVYDMKTGQFSYIKGPIYSNMVLIDEINRAPAKTQSALFEVMEEKQISFEGETYPMDDPFFVIATQNPIEQEGTYRLPEAQLDRFLLKINLAYPSLSEEIEILNRFKNQENKDLLDQVKKVLKKKELRALKATAKEVHIAPQMIEYAAQIVHETRENGKIYLGGSPRASLALMNTSKVAAILAGRDFVTPEDMKYMAPYILNHRIILTPDAEMEGLTELQVIKDILETIEVPR